MPPSAFLQHLPHGTAPFMKKTRPCRFPLRRSDRLPRVGPYNFSTTGVQENDGGFLMNRVINEKMGAKSVAIVYTNNDYGLNMLSYMTQEAEADGVVITTPRLLPPARRTSPSFPRCARSSRKPLHYGQLQRSSNCVKQIRQVGWDVPVAISGSAPDRPAGGAVGRRRGQASTPTLPLLPVTTPRKRKGV